MYESEWQLRRTGEGRGLGFCELKEAYASMQLILGSEMNRFRRGG